MKVTSKKITNVLKKKFEVSAIDFENTMLQTFSEEIKEEHYVTKTFFNC